MVYYKYEIMKGNTQMKRIAFLLALCIMLGAVGCAQGADEPLTEDTVQTEEGTEMEENTVIPPDDFSPKATIVNKNGAKGVVTYVIDDYFRSEASFAMDMMEIFM